MDMSGEQLIPASREAVWDALNDPEILRACIPGCQELTRISETEMTAVAVVKVGPVSARFQGAVTLSDLDPPNGYTITGEGQGGVAGFARGGAKVQLEPADGGTLLRYTVEAQIGGKLAQLGGRLIDATARKMSGLFFQEFARQLLARRNGDGNPAAGGSDSGSQVRAPAAETARTAPSREIRLATAAIVLGITALIWFAYFGGLSSPATPAGDASVSPDFVAAVQLVMAASIGYLFGRLRR